MEDSSNIPKMEGKIEEDPRPKTYAREDQNIKKYPKSLRKNDGIVFLSVISKDAVKKSDISIQTDLGI